MVFLSASVPHRHTLDWEGSGPPRLLSGLTGISGQLGLWGEVDPLLSPSFYALSTVGGWGPRSPRKKGALGGTVWPLPGPPVSKHAEGS